MPRLRPLVVLMFVLLSSLPALAANRFWTGSANGNWSNPANWGGTAPSPGDTLYFYDSGANKATTNDFPAGFQVNGIVAHTGYSFAGNAIDFSGNLNVPSGTVVTLPIRLTADILLMPTGGTLSIGSTIDLNGHVLTVSPANATVALNGIISGAGQVVKNHGGGVTSTLSLNANNTYTGLTRVNGGRLLVTNANGLGAAANSALNRTIIYDGASLIVTNAMIGEALEIGGNGHNDEGALQTNATTVFNGSLTLTQQTRAVIEGSLAIHGRISGPGGLTLHGGGELTLYDSSNDFAGPLQWLNPSSSVTLIWGADNVLPSTLDLELPAPAILDLNGHAQTLRSVRGYGVIELTGVTDAHLTLTNAQGLWDGQIIGAGDVSINGGSMEIVDANIISGDVIISNATIAMNGNASFSNTTNYRQSSGSTSMNGGADFNGPVLIDGGQFRALGVGNTRNITFDADATYTQVITGPATSQFGNLHVTGAVTLGGATFALNQTGVVPAGTLMIIENDGTDPVSGTFAALPEGATITGGLQSFTISYAGGTGNDVVLTAAAVNTTTSLTSAPNPSTTGQNVTLTATVTPTAGTATGTVTFLDGATTLGSAPLNASGVATLTINTLTVGSHTLTAQYAGQSPFNASTSAPHTHVVNGLAATTTALTSNPNPSLPGANVTFTATVTSTSPGTPTGTVTFRDGTTVLGTSTLASGVATFSTTTLAPGSHSITATYNGNGTFATSVSSATTHVVTADAHLATVPALDARGLALLAALLGVVAVFVMRR